LGLALLNPVPDVTKPPVVSVIDLKSFRKGERFVFFFVLGFQSHLEWGKIALIDDLQDDSGKIGSGSGPCPCPCCGGRMIIIESFARGCQPKHWPTPASQEIRIDTS